MVDEAFDESYMWHFGGTDIPGREALKQVVTMYRVAFPDIHLTIEDMLADGDKVMTRFEMRGTNTGEFMEMPPTNKQVTMMGLLISRFVDGKNVEDYEVVDSLGMMQQLGVVPTPG